MQHVSMGAFQLESGVCWKWIIPKALRVRAQINVLEFLTQVIRIQLDVLENRIPYTCAPYLQWVITHRQWAGFVVHISKKKRMN